MVNFFHLILFCVCFGMFQVDADVSVDASINNRMGYVGEPIQGTVIVTHDGRDKIDQTSFELEGEPLKTILMNTMPMTSGQGEAIVSIYKFELPARQEGLYALPPISIKVAGKRYQSIPAGFEVKLPNKNKSIVNYPVANPKPGAVDRSVTMKNPPNNANKETVFQLESLVEGPTTFYPGQRAKFMYRIYYNHSVDLSESHFPLLDAEGFKKVGDIEAKDYEKNGLSLQELIQVVEAIRPGTFHFDAASASGYTYENKAGQGKVYDTQLRKADSPSIDVVVLDFPTKNQPASFTGGMGSHLEGKMKMLTPTDLQIDDSIHLELSITGPTNLGEMDMPHLDCQPGIAGFFELSDLPPSSVKKQLSKEFNIELRPVSSFVKAIPSIELSIFDPNTQEYIVWRSDPIPLKVSSPPVSPQTMSQAQRNIYDLSLTRLLPFLEPPIFDAQEIIKKSNVVLDPIRGFDPILIGTQDLRFRITQTSWVFFVIPFGLLFLFWQYKMRDDALDRMRKRKETNEEILKRIFNKAKKDLQVDEKWKYYVGLLKTALFFRLRKSGYLSDREDAIKNITHDPRMDEVKAFLNDLEERQYGLEKVNEHQFLELREKTRILMDDINS